MKKYIKHMVALLISATCIYVAFRGVNFREAAGILDKSRLRVLPLAGFTSLCLAVMWVRAWRWKYFYLPQHKATTGGLTTANLIGFMSNNILPLRIGEMVRALMARRKVPGAPLSYTVATLFVERVFDTLCLLFYMIIPLLFSRNFPPFVLKIGMLMTWVFFGGLLMLIVLRLKPRLVLSLALPPARRVFPAAFYLRFESFLHTFTEGLMILRNGPAMLKITALSLFHWWLVVFSYSLAFKGFSFDSLPWSAPYVTLGLVGIGVALPSAPAFVGPIHAAIIYSLSDIYGIAKSMATGFAVVIHLLMMAPLTVVGLSLMWHEGLSIGQIRRKAETIEVEQLVPEPAE
jgi:glycosyltransferase 2 family protein